MTSILALDLATTSGWAYTRPGFNIPKYGSTRISFEGAPLGRFLVDFESWLLDLTAVCGPEVVIFEAPWVGPKTHQDTARKLLGLACVTELVCTRLGLRVYEEKVNTVRKSFGAGAGMKRRDAKRAVMQGCRLRGWPVKDDNEADALALLDYAVHRLRQVEQGWAAGPLFGSAAR